MIPKKVASDNLAFNDATLFRRENNEHWKYIGLQIEWNMAYEYKDHIHICTDSLKWIALGMSCMT